MTVWRLAGWALALFALAMVLLLSHKPASAQPMSQCGPWAVMKKWLAEEHQETATGAGGVKNEQAIVEVYASRDGATFTIIVRSTGGGACIIASGTDWQPGQIVSGEET